MTKKSGENTNSLSWLESIQSNQLIVGLILFYILFRGLFISSFPIGLDEPFSIYWAQQPWADMLEMFQHENNPPLHFIILKFWTGIWGDSAVAVRSVSLIFSALAIIPIVKLGELVGNRRVGVILFGFYLFSSFHHYFALEARTYSLIILLFSWILFELYKLLFTESKSFIGLALANTLLLYAHYSGVLIVGFELVVLLLFINTSIKKIKSLLLAFLVTLVLFIPGIGLMMTRVSEFSVSNSWVPIPHWTELYGNVFRFLNGTVGALVLILAVKILVLIAGKKYWKEYISKKFLFALLFFFVPYLGMFIVSFLYQPVFLDRYLLFTTIPLFLIIALVADKSLEILKKPGLIYLLLIPIIPFFEMIPSNDRSDDEIADFVRKYENPNSSIIMCPPAYDLTFMYHYDRETFANYSSESNEKFNAIYNVDEISFSELNETVIFVDAKSEFLYPDNGIITLLNKGYELKDSREFEGGYRVWIYE
ncbi:MAG: glycosyltransferase family 39 protein [Crocinitomicaceae bacterium]|nr:glycosyltransferase family 39 protein [Crocinitomicaceae bacterium]